MNELARPVLVFAGSIGAIHLMYEQIIRPKAEAAIEAARIAGVSAPREWTVILKDWEQEICLVLLVFCVIQILTRMWALASERYLFRVDIFKEAGPPHRYTQEISDEWMACATPERQKLFDREAYTEGCWN